MKNFIFEDVTGTIKVEYLTDAVGSTENFTIYQIKQYVNGVATIGLNADAIQLGMPDAITTTSIQEFKALATQKNMSLTVYENTVNGVTEEAMLYYGGAIGEELL